MTATNIHLVRHGEAEVNVNQIVGGMRGDTGLTPRGVGEAQRLRDRLAHTREIKADALLASTLPRARQTAEIIAPALGLPVQPDDELHELRPGEADGLTITEGIARYGIPDFERDPERILSPGGESWADLMRRAGRALERIAEQHEGKTVVIVTHGGFIDGAFVHFLGLSSFPPVQFATRHTSLTHWQRTVRWNQAVGWRLMCFNDVAHLAR